MLLLFLLLLVVATRAYIAPQSYRLRRVSLYHEACENTGGPKNDDKDFTAMLDSLDELIAQDGFGKELTSGSVNNLSSSSSSSSVVEQSGPASLPLSKYVAVMIGIVFGFSYYLFENFTFGNDALANGATLLKLAEADSVSLNDAMCAKNLKNKPTVIDFYAPWCENCKTLAPTLKQLESAYKNDINFITIDGSNPKNSDLVSRFHVDGIPQLSFINRKGELLTSLVGAVPKPILKEELDAFLTDKGELPYSGMTPSMFNEQPETAVELERGTCTLPTTTYQ
jgi:thiol-disulfide isomerase/thioredoxin